MKATSTLPVSLENAGADFEVYCFRLTNYSTYQIDNIMLFRTCIRASRRTRQRRLLLKNLTFVILLIIVGVWIRREMMRPRICLYDGKNLSDSEF